ncbi:DNA-directed RNA polymerase I subunit rpa49 [Quillaja saponaria]|uniref:DNA-directed RNA polymerase I subunit rpa49 n=1 Tax=Quillaja saponaria TaxID=32244 RepID=A0AAD7L520_QUISA|nr:DNA-directed RNA polymerase I subunit rpa49 [Quillaja saponaria]
MDSEAEDTKSQVENVELQTELEPVAKKAKKTKTKKKKEAPPIQAKVKVLREHPEKIPPFVGYFPSGFNPHKNPDDGSESESECDLTTRVYRNKNMSKRLQLVVSPTGSTVDFVGTSYSGEAAAGQRCMYALGVLDKATQILKVVPIAANKIFRLEPKVKGSDLSDKEPTSVVKEELTQKQKAEKVRALTNRYGTKKANKEAAKLEALRDDPESQKDLDVQMKNIVVNKQALEGTEAHISRNIPPYDASATTPQEAYQLDKIILRGEWDYLGDIFELLHLGPEVDISGYPTFVSNRIDKLRAIQDEDEKTKLCCIFSYLNHLIKFKDQHSMDGASSAKGHRIPSILRHKFSTMFAVSDTKRLPAEKIDLLISYVLVLTLFADEFRTDYSDIAKDLRMSSVSLREHFEHLGCKILSRKNVRYATLPVPLQFPLLRQKRRR